MDNGTHSLARLKHLRLLHGKRGDPLGIKWCKSERGRELKSMRTPCSARSLTFSGKLSATDHEEWVLDLCRSCGECELGRERAVIGVPEPHLGGSEAR